MKAYTITYQSRDKDALKTCKTRLVLATTAREALWRLLAITPEADSSPGFDINLRFEEDAILLPE